ncbi:unnamed protein product, partial [Meganyctiphanes norvegica]
MKELFVANFPNRNICHIARKFAPTAAAAAVSASAPPPTNHSSQPKTAPTVKANHSLSVSIQDLGFGAPSHACGGTIISADAIITSATCANRRHPKNMQVVVGDYNLNLQEGDEQIIEVSQIIPHPEYSIYNMENDIAILKLSTPLEFNKYVQAIDLPPYTGFHASGECTMSGWGSSHSSDDNLTDILQKILLPIITVSECNALLYGDLGLTVSRKKVCAGYTTSGKNECISDDGGPLTCLLNGRPYLAGVLSYDLGCFDNEYPGVYTDIEDYIEWIENNA